MNHELKQSMSPQIIVENKINFRVPLYQRPYAWETEQVNILLNDLWNSFKNNEFEQYHLGILSVANTASNENLCLDLIDGQQRITTLILIGNAAHEYYREWGNFLKSERLDLYGRKNDKNFLENFNNHYANPKLKNTLDISTKFFIDIKNTEDKYLFSKFIYEKSVLFLAKVPESYSLEKKNQQFVRMNNRGKQLEKHEILKVKIIGLIPEADQDKYLNCWNEMVMCLTGTGSNSDKSVAVKTLEEILSPSTDNKNDEKERESLYTSIVNIPEFLLIALARYRQKNISHDKNRLINTFNLDKNEVISFMEVFKSQLNILKKFFVFHAKAGNYELGEKGKQDGDKEDILYTDNKKYTLAHLLAIQSFLHVSTEPHHWLIPAFNWCAKFEKEKIISNEFISILENIDNDLIKNKTRSLIFFPSLDEMSYLNRPNYYWFYRLDYELWKSSKLIEDDKNIWDDFKNHAKKNINLLNILKNFEFKRCGSIEHIKPQVSQDLPTQEPEHEFGNIALISGSRNSKFGNNNPDGKRASILESKYTESLKMLHFLYSDKNTVDQGKIMYDLLFNAVKNSFPAAVTAPRLAATTGNE